MHQKTALLCLFILATPAAAGGADPVLAKTPPIAEIHNIYEYCRKTRTDPAVIAKLKTLGLDLSVDGDGATRFFEPVLHTDYDFISITLNPQTYQTIQGIFITWQKNPGLNYETIQRLTGLSLPPRGAKEIRVGGADFSETSFYILGHQNAHHPELTQVTFTCAPNNYDRCWELKIACYGFEHAN